MVPVMMLFQVDDAVLYCFVVLLAVVFLLNSAADEIEAPGLLC
jgi:hypothetical protein